MILISRPDGNWLLFNRINGNISGLLCIRGGSYLSSADYLESTLRGVSAYRRSPAVISGLRMIMRYRA